MGIATPILATPIGGFFEEHRPDGVQSGQSVVDAWSEGRPYTAFANARAAFAALAASFPDAVIWLPAFLCADMVRAAYARRVRFYPVQDGFEPDLDVIDAGAKAGDMVLLVAYFGQPLGQNARAFVEQRPDLRIVEDRAQALDAGPGGGAWRLYSPRKLLGVADGGLLVGPDGADLPRPTKAADAAFLWMAPRLRGDDPEGRHNAVWHAANQAKEAAMSAASEAMTPQSRSILAQTSLASLTAPRLRNWRILDQRLRAWSALPADPSSPPLGYVLRLASDQRDRVLRGLHEARIFAGVHWPTIAGPADAFPREHQWTRELITLPCDHRYGETDMTRIADAVTGLLA